MRSNEKPAFREALADAYVLYRTALSAGVLELWWNALKDHNLADVRSALETRIKDGDQGRFCPVPADIIRIITAATADPVSRCWNCQVDLAKLGRTKLRAADVCNPCYAAYLRNEWDPAKVTA